MNARLDPTAASSLALQAQAVQEATPPGADHERLLGDLGLVTMTDSTAKPARAVVFLTGRTAQAMRSFKGAEFAAEVNSGAGAVRTAIVPVESLDALASHPDVEQVTVARRLRYSMDEARKHVHVGTFRASSGLDGSGVLVGVIDSGIDPKHPAFAGRILRIWDQTLHGPGVPEGGYGVELPPLIPGLSRSQIEDFLSMSRDEIGHGTHVAGIAAARELNADGTDGRFTGVAPAANLLIVKTTMLDANIADGLRYLARVAKELKRPIVINLSLGGHFDAHDGSDPLSRILDDISGNGCIVCVAAGNEGDDPIHALLAVPSGGWRTARFEVPSGRSGLALNAWHPGGQAFEAMVSSPVGSTPWVPTGSAPAVFDLPDGRVFVASGGVDPANLDTNVVITVVPRPATQTVGQGQWRVRFKSHNGSSGDVHIWLNDLSDTPRPAPGFVGSRVSDDTKIGSPGAAARAITVGAFITRTTWVSEGGSPVSIQLADDSIAGFSSEGPRRQATKPRSTAHEKPTVIAPGAMIISVRSADAQFDPGRTISPFHVAMPGTSMATPFVSGLVALLLQRDPKLNADGAIALLRSAAAIPNRPLGSHDTKWGYGLIDARKL